MPTACALRPRMVGTQASHEDRYGTLTVLERLVLLALIVRQRGAEGLPFTFERAFVEWALLGYSGPAGRATRRRGC